MAFTPLQRAKIKMYLGHPTISRAQLHPYGDLGSAGTQLALVADYNLGAVDPEAEALALEILERVECIVKGYQPEAYASQNIKRSGEIEFAGLYAILGTNIAFVQETARLSDILHIPKAGTSELHGRLGSGQGCVQEVC